jgi:hypothetical protein
VGRDRLSLAPYEALVALAEEERTLALDGRWTELSELLGRRGAALATLPDRDPAAARPLLERALAAHAQAHAAMQATRAGLLAELGETGQTRAAVAGYRSTAGAQGDAPRADYRG